MGARADQKPQVIIFLSDLVPDGKERVNQDYIGHDLLKFGISVESFFSLHWPMFVKWEHYDIQIPTIGITTADVDWLVLDGRPDIIQYLLDSLPDEFRGKIIVVADESFEHEKANFVVCRISSDPHLSEPFVCCQIAEKIRDNSQ